MTAPDNSNDAVQFLYKHGDLTYSAAHSAVEKLCNNGFRIVRADLAAVHAQVRVTPLVWHDCADGTSHDDGCRYEIERDSKQYWRIIRGVTGGSSYLKHARSLDDAKSLAKADYEARILAAIELQPDPRDAVIARLVEALESIADPDRVASYGDPVVLRDVARAALAAAKAVQHG